MTKRKNVVISRVIRADGSYSEWGIGTNLRVNDGINWQAELMGGDTGFGSLSTNRPKQIAVTEDTAAPAASDSSILAELAADGMSRQTATFTHTADQSSYTQTLALQYTGGSTITVAKAGMMSNATLPAQPASFDTMFVETALSPVAVLDSNDTVEIQWGIFY